MLLGRYRSKEPLTQINIKLSVTVRTEKQNVKEIVLLLQSGSKVYSSISIYCLENYPFSGID